MSTLFRNFGSQNHPIRQSHCKEKDELEGSKAEARQSLGEGFKSLERKGGLDL